VIECKQGYEPAPATGIRHGVETRCSGEAAGRDAVSLVACGLRARGARGWRAGSTTRPGQDRVIGRPGLHGQPGRTASRGAIRAFTSSSRRRRGLPVVDRSGSMWELGSNRRSQVQELLRGRARAHAVRGAIHFGTLSIGRRRVRNNAAGQVRAFNKGHHEPPRRQTRREGRRRGRPQQRLVLAAGPGTPGHEARHPGDRRGPNCNYFLSASRRAAALTSSQYCCTNYRRCACGEELPRRRARAGRHRRPALERHRHRGHRARRTGYYAQLLNQMRSPAAGPTPARRTTTGNNQTELQAALQTIAVSVISCQIDLQERPSSGGVKSTWTG